MCRADLLRSVVICECNTFKGERPRPGGQDAGMHIHPHRAGRHTSRECCMGAILSGAWHTGSNISLSLSLSFSRLVWSLDNGLL
jgi:hypothetical protein